ncbi:MAG: 3',5'-cyclic adenosine monophosphate phosphodiesterase CpdA [Candidatus Anoxychlamydiales bacterium]|nr:3',5'-cyclic adenosine monophosphate phosphodiesterase CpdA [Candidatus Anoxychlamydiales bacterium]
MIKIAHISDLHFSKLSFHPKIFFSKRFVGMTNLFFNRKRKYKTNKLSNLPVLFKKEDIDYAFISGDITTTSHESEFILGKNFVDSILQNDIKTYLIPGNHDCYTKSAYKKKLFYKYFENESLRNNNIESLPLENNWHYIGLDCSISTFLLSSSGCFSKDLENKLNKLLNTLEDKKVILVNHFPASRITTYRKRLIRDSFLKELLKKHKNIKLYLYGHTHKYKIEKEKDLPYMICSGCASHIDGTFNIFSLNDNSIEVNKYAFKNDTWIKEKDQILEI